MLRYSTTNRDGYREYKSDAVECSSCPYLTNCTLSKSHQKTVHRHVWEEYMETCEDIRYTRGNRAIYEKRKETIERIFGTAKEMHGLRYTNMLGKARMEMKVGLTYLCMNLKKLAKMKEKYGLLKPLRALFYTFIRIIRIQKDIGFRRVFLSPVCLRSEETESLRALVSFLRCE